jgi:CelD/BcsL family acetyltransferase involved in cellulose biosynthesis
VAAASRAGAPIRLRREAPSFILPLPTTYDAWLAARSGKFRNHLRRMEKKLAATGAIRTAAVGPDDDLDAAFASLLAIEAQSWKHAHGTAISAVKRQARFYRDMAGAMRDRGRLHLTFLLRDDVPIAYNLGLVRRGQYAYLKTSFVESLKALGPATVLRARLIAALIDEGVETLDFPAEPYDWEAQWTSEYRPHHSLTLFNRTLRGRGLAWLQRLRDRRRSEPGACELAYADARALKPPADDE